MRGIRRLSSVSFILFAILVSGCARPTRDATIYVSSPDGRTTVTFQLVDGVPTYRVERDDAPLMDAARLGVTLADGASFDTSLVLTRQRTNSTDETWVQPWGEVTEVRDHHNELRVELQRSESPRRGMERTHGISVRSRRTGGLGIHIRSRRCDR